MAYILPMVRNNTTVFWLFVMAAIGTLVQLGGFINVDDAWLLDATKRFVDGEELNAQVVETNPPLIIYLTSIPVLVAKVLNTGAINSFIIFTTLLACFSCALTFSQIENRVKCLVIGAGMFLLPNLAYGEREHFLLILILPYFVLQYIEHKPNLTYRITSGIMAGIGFSIKPFFPAIWLAIIICRIVANKKVFTIENFLIGAIGISYLAYLFFIERNYVHNVLPILLKYYGAFGTNSWAALKDCARLIVAYQMAVLVLFIKNRKLLNDEIYFLTAASIISVILAAVQSKTWLNYFYPPLFFSLLSNAFILIAIYPNLKPLWNKAVFAIAGITMIALSAFALFNNLNAVHGQNYEETKQMINIFDKNAASKEVYALSFDLGAIYPVIVYSKAANHSRYGHLWMLPGMYKGQKVENGEMVYRLPLQQNADESKLFQSVVIEIIKLKPEVIVVSATDHVYLNAGQTYRFDFVKYFSSEPKFKGFWHNYKKIGRIDYQEIYKRQVFN